MATQVMMNVLAMEMRINSLENGKWFTSNGKVKPAVICVMI